MLDGFGEAFRLLLSFDADLVEIVLLSLRVSLTAVVFSALIGLPLGALLAVIKFPGRQVLVVLINAFMGLPPVVVGLIVYLLLSRSGPFGVFGLLFSPTAMIIAQTMLITPIVASLTRQAISDLWVEYRDLLHSFDATPWQIMKTLLWEGRLSMMTGILAGFGRAIAEVGAVMIVGGNIDHATRVLTTAIALETSKGDLGLALGLGIVLVGIAVVINILTLSVGHAIGRQSAQGQLL
ncbi:MAG: ABC transporter permease [Rhizobiales bacterium]|nr:ABC transporter permease [Hyphomicrobiales bacterium]